MAGTPALPISQMEKLSTGVRKGLIQCHMERSPPSALCQGPAAAFSVLGFVIPSWQVCDQLVEGQSLRPGGLPRLSLMQNQLAQESTPI